MSVSRKMSYGAALVGLIGCFTLGIAVAGSHKDFADTSEKWEAAYNSGDAAAIAALYTEGGLMMPPNAEAMQGRKAIETYLVDDIKAAPGRLEIETAEHGHSGNLGFARGTWAMHDADGNVVDKGKWVEVRKKVNGKWMIHSDIWNSDMALPGQ
ncbi:MAG: DUF4440 domain-containing protein [Acidobacteriota bacterium]|nr:DUF4440 domain-containing protein [Acidobacteriota bacterium]